MSRNNHGEDDEQSAFINFCEYNKQLKHIYAIPNGGKRDVREAARLKKQGVKAGVLDLFLPKPKGIYHGCYLEFKYGKNKLTSNQIDFALDAVAEGYCVFVCYSSLEAIAAINLYMGLNSGGSISESCRFLSSKYIEP